MPLEHNGGFSYGNNAGIREALASADQVDYVMLLNPDTVARKEAIKALVEFMDGHPHVGIAGSLLEKVDGGVECSAHRIPSPLSELDFGARLGLLSRALQKYVVSSPLRTAAHSCDWVSGASLIMRRPVLEKIGLMDDGFFLYFEDCEYCFRARNAGWDIVHVPSARIIHLHGQSSQVENMITKARAC